MSKGNLILSVMEDVYQEADYQRDAGAGGKNIAYISIKIFLEHPDNIEKLSRALYYSDGNSEERIEDDRHGWVMYKRDALAVINTLLQLTKEVKI